MNVTPTQRQVRCFLEAVRRGSVTAAAAHLAISQPAVSRTLNELERLVGTRLMQRSQRGIVLTAAGETFLRYATASVSALDVGLQQVARQRTDARRSLCVGMLPTATGTLLPLAVRDFKREHGDVALVLVHGTNHGLLQKLREGELDFVVGRLGASEDMVMLEFMPLYNEALMAVIGRHHPLAEESNVIVVAAGITAGTIILPPRNANVRSAADDLLTTAGVTGFDDIIETDSTEFARSCLALMPAVWVVPSGVVSADLKSGSMSALNIAANNSAGAVGITRRRDLRPSDLARELIDMIRAARTAIDDGLTAVAPS